MYIKTNSIHLELDTEFINKEYEESEGKYRNVVISSPLCFWEYSRNPKIGLPKECHLFLWTIEEKITNSAVTKIGGIPYLPINQGWPKDATGKNLNFLMQINFMDSKELVSVPNDILLVFTPNCKDTFKGFEDEFVYVWVKYQIQNEIFNSFPDNAESCTDYQYDGVIHKTLDYSESIMKASKIGGYPTKLMRRENSRDLFTFTFIGNWVDETYPFVNRKEPIGDEKYKGFSWETSIDVLFEMVGVEIYCEIL